METTVVFRKQMQDAFLMVKIPASRSYQVKCFMDQSDSFTSS